jgi:exodeoxyribonuclease-5
MINVELTEEQLELKRQIIQWYHNFPYGKPYFYYSGAAGTGKTTVMKSIIDELGLKSGEFIACAYVGKAVLVLLQHGLPASTIHSLIFNLSIDTEYEIVLDEWGNPHKEKRKVRRFTLKDHIPKGLKLIFLDECAMVSDTIREQLQSFGVPIVMAGDQNQLPPVSGKCSIIDSPDFVLHQIMRQEEGNPIVYLSQCILNGTPIPYGTYGASQVVEHYDLSRKLLEDFDVILCTQNKLREEMNDYIRHNLLHRNDRMPIVGDKVICRENNWEECIGGTYYLTNGLVGKITRIDKSSIHRDILYIDFKPEFTDEVFKKLTVDYNYMISDWKDKKNYPIELGKNKKELFEYAYALTVHLSQGSEYNRVLYIDKNRFGSLEDQRRMQYTAVTRAKQSLLWVKPENQGNKYFQYNGSKYQKPIVW